MSRIPVKVIVNSAVLIGAAVCATNWEADAICGSSQVTPPQNGRIAVWYWWAQLPEHDRMAIALGYGFFRIEDEKNGGFKNSFEHQLRS